MSEQFKNFANRATFAASDFEEDIDSTIVVRGKARGSKLEQAFSKKRGKVLEETEHTITFLPKGKKKATKLAKRDVAKAISPPKKPEERTQKKVAEIHETTREAAIMEEEMSDGEVLVQMLDKSRSSEITPIETNLEIEKEASSEEAAREMKMSWVVQKQQS